MLKPINDLAMIEVTNNKNKVIDLSKDTAESGILVQLPDQFNYVGMWSFAFEDSFMNREKLNQIYEYWKTKIGQRVFWTALSEKGNILKDGEKEYAFVKLTSLIAIAEAGSDARNIHGEGSGAFNI